MRLIANKPIAILLEPQLSLPFENPVDLFRRERFPGVKDRREHVSVAHLEHGVHVIRHHTPRDEAVALSVKMKKRTLCDSRRTGIAKNARSVTSIFVVL